MNLEPTQFSDFRSSKKRSIYIKNISKLYVNGGGGGGDSLIKSYLVCSLIIATY